jgi:hypothetical protein
MPVGNLCKNLCVSSPTHPPLPSLPPSLATSSSSSSTGDLGSRPPCVDHRMISKSSKGTSAPPSCTSVHVCTSVRCESAAPNSFLLPDADPRPTTSKRAWIGASSCRCGRGQLEHARGTELPITCTVRDENLLSSLDLPDSALRKVKDLPIAFAVKLFHI